MDQDSSDDLTIVSRASANLLGRRWPVLFTELVLVVAGILIALAIDGWAQDREDRRAETIYLELLIKDLEDIEAELHFYIDFEQRNSRLGAEAYTAISERNLPGDIDEIQLLISALGSRRTLRIDSAAYLDMTSTGNIQLIRDRALRERIIRYFTTTERVELVVEKNNRAFIDDLYFPFLLEFGITVNLDLSTVPLIRDANEIVTEMLGSEYEAPRDAVLSSPADDDVWNDLRRHVLFRMRIATVGVLLTEDVARQTSQLRGAIATSLQDGD